MYDDELNIWLISTLFHKISLNGPAYSYIYSTNKRLVVLYMTYKATKLKLQYL
jgi:hypothetical protein